MKRKVLLTAADVLVHSYGKTPEEAASMVGGGTPKVAAPPAPPPAPEPTPAPEPEPTPDPELSAEAETLVAKFVDDYLKDDLVAIAEDNGVDSSGYKADIARRLVAAGFVPEEPEE